MQIAGIVARWVALAVMIAGGVLASVAMHPADASHDDFQRALSSGEVHKVVIRSENSSADVMSDPSGTWSTGLLQWRHGTVADGFGATKSDFLRLMDSHGVRVDSITQDDEDSPFEWTSLVMPRFGTVFGLTWLATLLAMLCSVPRLGNRWAWFWLFVFGQIGAFLYLLLEPAPLWRGRGTGTRAAPVEPPDAVDAAPANRWSGPQGCLMSILAAIAAAAASSAIGWGVSRIMF